MIFVRKRTDFPDPLKFTGGIQAPHLAAAVQDIVAGISQWRTWWVLARNDVEQRYRRSRIGQFWLTISMAVSIAGIGIVFSVIFAQPLTEYLSFLGFGIIIWGFISTTTTDLSTSFVSSELYLKSYPGPRSIVIYRTIARNLIILVHNLIIIPLLWIAFGPPVNWNLLLFLPGLLLVVLNFGWLGLFLGTLSARFRDIPQILMSLVQLLFFLTPVIYRPEQIASKMAFLSDYNPLANAVEVLRAPLLGQIPDGHHYVKLCIFLVFGYGATLLFYARFRARIVYWL